MRNQSSLGPRLFALTSLILFVAPCSLRGQAALPEIAYGASKASDIIKQAEQTANNILSNAEMASNRVMTDAALKLNVISQNLNLVLGNNINTTFDRLNSEERNAVSQLNIVIDQANAIMAKGGKMEDDLDIDLNNSLAIFKNAPLSISRIAGLYQLHQGLPYPVVIRGNGFGLNGLSAHTTATVFLNGHQIDAQFISPNDKHETILAIPPNMLEPYFSPTYVTNVALWINLTDSSGWFSAPKQYSFNLRIVLFPRASAVLDVVALINEQTWDSLPQIERAFVYPAHGDGGTGHLQFRHTDTFADNLQVAGVRLEWKPGERLMTCDWCKAPDTTQLEQNQNKTYEFDNNNHTITFKAACNGNVCNISWIATFRQLGSKTTVVPVATKQPVGYGEQFSFDLPPNTADWAVSGHFYSGQPIVCKKGNCGSFMDAISETPIAAGQTRVTFKLRSPFQQRAPTP